VGPGLFLLVVGAILAFGVTDHLDNVNLGVVGLILMVAGAATIANARRTAVRERIVVERGTAAGVDGTPGATDAPVTHVVEEVERVNDVDQVHRRGQP